MSTLELIELIERLPADKKKAVENLVHVLSTETGTEVARQLSSENKDKIPREFGSLKGFVKYIADDFDAPLEDFKDYM